MSSCVKIENLPILTGIWLLSFFAEEPAPCEEGTLPNEEEEKGVGWEVGDTSILATSSTMLLEAIWIMALEELLLELDASSGPEEAAEEEEEEEEEDEEAVVVVLCDSADTDGLLRLCENDPTIEEDEEEPMTSCLDECPYTSLDVNASSIGSDKEGRGGVWGVGRSGSDRPPSTPTS